MSSEENLEEVFNHLFAHEIFISSLIVALCKSDPTIIGNLILCLQSNCDEFPGTAERIQKYIDEIENL